MVAENGRITADTHPVLRQRGFAIEAPPVREFLERFDNCLRVGELSLCAYGVPRVGKTTTLRHLSRVLEENCITVVAGSIERQQRPKVIDKKELWDEFLKTELQKAWHSPSASREALLNHLMVSADRLGNKRVVLLCDEAQNLVVQHLAMLKKLTDELIHEGFSPFILIMGQSEILRQIEKLREERLYDLVDRFFTNQHRFRGLSPDEIQAVLAAYDVIEFPLGSGISFTAYFAPELFRAGWRLEVEAEAFAREFSSVYLEYRLGAFKELEMKYLVSAVRWLLTSLSEQRRIAPSRLIGECVRRCGLIEARRTVGDIGQLAKYD